MPRTKYVRSAKQKQNTKNDKIECDDAKVKKLWLDQFERDYESTLSKLKDSYCEVLDKIEAISFVELSNLGPDVRKLTLGALRADKSPVSINALSNTLSASVLQILNNTKNSTLAKSRKLNTSDEAAETRASSSDRARSRTVKAKQKPRQSRSVSRSNMPKHVTIHPSAKTTTPAKSNTKYTAMGVVTPKIKPNFPLSVLRRPKQGETAISLQGSPLLVSGVITEACANVNIPLHDGRIISLQPTGGIRTSQIPKLDELTKKQLVALRKNIDKVVEQS